MTRWFFLFFLALTLIISFRVITFSSAPIRAVACDSVSIESDLSGIWDLNRIDNFSGFEPYLTRTGLENYDKRHGWKGPIDNLDNVTTKINFDKINSKYKNIPGIHDREVAINH